MLIDHLKAIIQAVNQPLLLLSAALVTGIIVLGIIKLLNHRSFGYAEFFGLLVLTGIYIYFYPFKAVYQYLFVSALVLLLFYSAFTYCKIYKRQNLRREKIVHHLKNTDSDYFFSTNAKDKIVDASVSVSALSGLTPAELKKEKGLDLLLNNFDITKIGGKEANETALEVFREDYKKSVKPYQLYKFEIEALVKGKIESFRGIVQPLYDGEKFLGKNVYLTQNRLEILDFLRQDLDKARQGWEDALCKAHILMSLSNQAILYYDFQTKTYVATDLFQKATSLGVPELSFDDFIAMIHPDDLDFYIEQASTVNSLSTTRLKYRLLVNGSFYHVVENAIYLEKERGLVSVIHLLGKAEDAEEDVLKDEDEEAKLKELEDSNPKEAFEKIETILKTALGKIDEEI